MKRRLAACAIACTASNALAVALSPTLDIESTESSDSVKGEIRASVDHPFAMVSTMLRQPSQWCEILILHINVKYCRASGESPASRVRVVIGGKQEESVEEGHPVDFAYRLVDDAAQALKVTLSAVVGPLGTSNYLIVLDATPAETGRTLIRMSYSYSFGIVAGFAMQAYLATSGRDKVGFTVVGTGADGGPRYIGGMRGVTERNTMRYYLAIDAFLGALSSPPGARLEKRLGDWFAGIERYPRQLHEIERTDYLVMKRAEHARQQASIP